VYEASPPAFRSIRKPSSSTFASRHVSLALVLERVVAASSVGVVVMR
jgi:hypothetical protein